MASTQRFSSLKWRIAPLARTSAADAEQATITFSQFPSQ